MKGSRFKFFLFTSFLLSIVFFIFFDSSKNIIVDRHSTLNDLKNQFQINYGITFEIKGEFHTNDVSIDIPEDISIKELQSILKLNFGCSFLALQFSEKKAINKIDQDKTIEQQAISYSGQKKRYIGRAIFLGVSMFIFWIFEIIPIFVTALFPIIFGPMLGLIDYNQIALAYGNQNVFLFLGGFIIALALEKWKVHDQITRRIISLVGSKQRSILLGFIFSSAILSMWISNTSTTLIMLPIALSFLNIVNNQENNSNFAVLLLLSIAYGANIGGMATLVGSPPNIQMAALLEQQFGIEISFWDWFIIGLPISLLLIFLLFFYFSLRLKKNEDLALNGIKLKEPWTSNQKKVLLVFISVVFFWMFRGTIQSIIGIDYKDLVPALLGSIFLFTIPTNSNKDKTILTWDDTKKLPWGILLLFGGGLALAKILELNGVVGEIMAIIKGFSTLNLFAILIILVTITIFATEVISNLALVTLFVPVVGVFALFLNIELESLVIPVALSASCAFMFPISTPPNAIVFSSGKISMGKMIKIGLFMNVIAIIVISIVAYLILF